jgi:aerobic carbon-monoxide dehydrogenase medium subunit
VIPAAADYVRAASLDEALAALADPEAKVLAGGQSLLPVMKLRLARPALLVDIGGLDLAGVSVVDGSLRIGALTTWDELERAAELERPALAGLAECAQAVGDLQVRNWGTVGGSLAHADPAADAPAVLLALGATLELRSPGGTRTVPLVDFVRGPFLTALEPAEIVTQIAVPLPEAGAGSAYDKVEHPASGFALAGAAAVVQPDGASLVALTGIGARPLALAGDGVAEELAAAEVYGDDFASAEYRRHLAAVVARRALDRARKRAEEDSTWQA